MQEPQHLQVAQSREKRTPHSSVSIGGGLSVQLAHSSDSTESSALQRAVSTSRTSHSKVAAWEPNPREHLPSLCPWLAGTPAAVPAAMPISCLEGSAGQLSRSGVNSSLPTMTGGCRKKAKWDHYPHTLFILDGSGQGSEFVLFVFISFPHNLRSPSTETSQQANKPSQNGRVFSKLLAECPLE